MSVESDKTNTGAVATIVVVGVFAMISISALVTAMVRSEQTDLDAVRPEHADLETVAALKREQLASLHKATHWADQAAGKVAIPIDRAMKLVLDDYRKDPEAASPPIPPGLVLPPTPPDPSTGAAAEPGAAAAGALTATAAAPSAQTPAGAPGK
jgi:hypothetical protein